jgi:hypothetical protein
MEHLDDPGHAMFRRELPGIDPDGYPEELGDEFFNFDFSPSNSLNSLSKFDANGSSTGRMGITYCSNRDTVIDSVHFPFEGISQLWLARINYNRYDPEKCGLKMTRIIDSRWYDTDSNETNYGRYSSSPVYANFKLNTTFNHILPHPVDTNAVFFMDNLAAKERAPSWGFANMLHIIPDITQSPSEFVKNTSLYYEVEGEYFTGHMSFSQDGRYLYETRTDNAGDLYRGLVRINTATKAIEQLWAGPDFSCEGLHQDHTLDDKHAVVDYYYTPAGEDYRVVTIRCINLQYRTDAQLCTFTHDPDEQFHDSVGISQFDAHPNFSYSNHFIAFTYITDYKGKNITCMGLIPTGLDGGPHEIRQPEWAGIRPNTDSGIDSDGD